MFGKTEEKDMNKIVKAVGLAALAAIVVVTVASCNLVGMSVSGKVVNVRAPSTQTEFWKGTTNTSATLVGGTITLTNKKTTDTVSGTIDADGTYVIDGVAAGKYTISGSAGGWSFVDREVDITGYFATLPDVLAYETPANLDEILVMVEWGNTAMDVDAYVTRDTDAYIGNDYDGTIIAGFASGLTGGIGSTHAGTYGDYYYDTHGRVVLERDIIQVDTTKPEDVKLPRVETIRITGNYTNPETLRYYIRLFNQSTGTLTGYPGASAEATVFVMQGTTNMGTYKIAVNSSEMILGVLQMQWNNSDSSWTIASYSNPYFDSGDGTNLTGVRSLADGVVEVSAIK
jgi:hypothetical protein